MDDMNRVYIDQCHLSRMATAYPELNWNDNELSIL